MSTETITYIKWGDYKSQDQEEPDYLEFKVSDLGTFETEYSVNVQMLQKIDDKLEYRILPLKSHTSRNASLLKQWNDGVRTKKIREGKRIRLQTWIGKSKNGFPIRRYVLEF
ncbi:MAG: hypothetical protein KC444_01850 [Nitrosopumilus sp.]|nr:hypothetical protein [Nitrosopumilus sp.]